MRLNAIHMHGFKSFSDRTKVTVQDGLSGIVGPNGCGKSNIIDALRWGLGESRASSLRGGALQDILFNGSGKRAPADWCSVEMRFSTTDADDLGIWRGATDIAVRRELGRDGQSYFYINNQTVRRRDVVSLFRGTGVSPRSYAVVEQGMVGSIAEASADELRLFLEETAGVSHYKDRRRDSERRLASCRTNLEQLALLLTDLQRRSDSLKRQARAARRHRELSDTINDMEVVLIRQKREAAQQKLTVKESEIVALEENINKQRAELEVLRKDTEKFRRQHGELQQHSQTVESELVRAQTSAERLQQDYEQAEQKRQQLKERLRADNEEQTEIAATLAECIAGQKQAQTELGGIGGELETCIAVSEKQADDMETLQEAVRVAEQETETARRAFHGNEQRRESMRVQLQMAKQQQQSLRERIDELRAVLQKLQVEEETVAPSIDAKVEKTVQLQNALRQSEKTCADFATAENKIDAALHKADNARVAAQAEHDAMSSMAGDSLSWNVEPPRRLSDVLQAKAGDWARALDAALGRYAEAFAAESLDDFLQQNGLPPAGAGIVDMQTPPAETAPPKSAWVPLLSHIDAPAQAMPFLAVWLRGAFAADSTAEAQQARRDLSDGQMMITREGVVFMRDAVFVLGEAQGGFDFQRRLTALTSTIATTEETLQNLQKQLSDAQAQTVAAEQARNQATDALAAANDELSENRIVLGQWQERRRATANRRSEVESEIQVAEAQLQTAEEDIAKLDDGAQIQQECDTAQAKLAAAQAAADGVAEKLEKQRGEFYQSNINRREMHLREENLKQQIASLTQRTNELSRRQQALVARIAQGEGDLAQFEESALNERIEEQTSAVAVAQEKYARATEESKAWENKVSTTESTREQRLDALQQLQEQNTKLQVEQRELSLAVEGLDNSLGDFISDETRLQAMTDTGKTADELRSEIDQMRERLGKLGAINFAADREFSETNEQLTTMRSQKEDVEQSIEELQGTIRRIDGETRERIRSVYETINQEFGGLFKRLFGGGEAQLFMDGDSFLDAKFEIRARPPGKRMFPVRMLSGGEKTATALAFIFTLMRQTPPPFCIMDEVDATLDDSRADAFIALLSEMSQQFQCLVISHNKSTVEAMQHLIGVTQEEKGVSKVVSVTLTEALRTTT